MTREMLRRRRRPLMIITILLGVSLSTACRGCTDRRPAGGWDVTAGAADVVSDGGVSDVDDAQRADDAADERRGEGLSDAEEIGTDTTDASPDVGPAWCDPSTPRPTTPKTQKCGATVYGTEAQLRQTPRSRPELEWLAIEATDAFTAPKCLYDRVERDLSAIDRQYLDSYDPGLDPSNFLPAHGGRGLVVYVEPQTARAIRKGTYSAWDCLNDHYDKKRHDVLELSPDGTARVLVEFEGTYDMERLLGAYRRLPGLKKYDGKKVGFPRRIENVLQTYFDIRLDIDGDEYHYLLSFKRLRTEERPNAFSLFYCATSSGDGSLTLEGQRDQPPRMDAPTWSELCNDTFDP